MSYFRRDVSAEANNDFSKEVANSTLCRNSYFTRKFRVPSRYTLCLLLFLLVIIKRWRNTNVMFTLRRVISLDTHKEKMHSLGAWTLMDLDNLTLSHFVIQMFAQIPGAILIFIVGSHRYLLGSAIAISILHMLTPTVLQHHSVSLVMVLIAKVIFEAPIYIAVISMWRDWAPKSERTKLTTFSMAGLFIEYAASTHFARIFDLVTSNESFYISGMAGLVWAWYNIISDTPQNDVLISEQELQYLENNIPSDLQQKIGLKEIPCKSILTSKPVAILCIIFFKTACSGTVIRIGGTMFLIHLKRYHFTSLFMPFVIVFAIVIPCSAILADYLINKFSERTLLIRKCFLCGGFGLQCLFMFGTLSPSGYTKTVFFVLSYIIYAASIPGFITLALDLSPRYVTIIAGIAYTTFFIGPICMKYFREHTVPWYHLDTVSWVLFIDGVFSIASAALFAVWGEAGEQLWSTTSSESSRTNGCRSYPKADNQDVKLEPEVV